MTDQPARTTSPADTIRRAAAVLRERAQAATSGPWRTHDTHLDHGGHTATIMTGKPGTGGFLAWVPTMSHESWDDTRNAWHNADWIATVHPGVGLALADWLDAAAERAGLDPADADTRSDRAALAVARAIVGEGEQR